MKIGIISGSPRLNSQTHRIGTYVEQHLKSKSVDTYHLNLGTKPLPLWDESIYAAGSELQGIWKPIAKELQECQGFVILTPEWSGMAPSSIKNFFLFCGYPELGHKAAMLVSITSGISGGYPIAELRMSSYKNTHICYIPEQMIIRYVEQVFHGEEPASPIDKDLRERMHYSLDILLAYTTALNSVRAKGILDPKRFGNGM